MGPGTRVCPRSVFRKEGVPSPTLPSRPCTDGGLVGAKYGLVNPCRVRSERIRDTKKRLYSLIKNTGILSGVSRETS